VVAGRSTEARTTTVGITNTSAALTAVAGTFSFEDIGRTISGTGIPGGATIAAVASGTAATLSAPATATNASLSATLGPANPQAAGYVGWSPESRTENTTYSLAANNLGTATPDRLSNASTGVSQRSRD
jgi:hypothetical protein